MCIRDRYATKPAGTGNWTVSTLSNALARAKVVRLAAEPGTDRIAAVLSEGVGDNDVVGTIWDGDAFTDITQVDGVAADDDVDAGVGWVGLTGVAVLVYKDDDAGGAIDWARWDSSSGWLLQTDAAATGMGDLALVAVQSLVGSQKLMAVLGTTDAELWAAVCDGTSWTVTHGGAALESSLATAATQPFALAVQAEQLGSGVVSASRSTVTAAPSAGLPDDGAAVAHVAVTVVDPQGAPLAGRVVQLAATGSGNTLTPATGVTGATGVFTATLASTVAETKTLTATVDPGSNQVVLDDQPTVQFESGAAAISASLSTATASPASGVLANGTASSTITVTVRDTAGNPLAGQTVRIFASGSSNVYTQPAAVTGAGGVATATLASTFAEVKTITVTVNPGPGQTVLDDQPTVGFTGDPGAISASLSTVDASPAAGLHANGVVTTTISVTVRDDNGNIVEGQTVQLAATGTGNTLVQPSATTDAMGVATGTLASTVAWSTTAIWPGPGLIVAVIVLTSATVLALSLIHI